LIKKENILFITNFFPLYRKNIWEKLLSNKKSNVIFYFDPIQNEGIQVEELFFSESNSKENNFKKVKNFYFFGRVIWQSKIIKECLLSSFNQAIFLGDMNILSTWIGLIICRLRNKKTILWTHGFYGNEKFFKRYLRVVFYSIGNKYLLYEQRGKKLMINAGFDSSKIFVVYNSLDYELQKKYFKKNQEYNLRRELNFFKNPNLKTILFLGRLTSVKKIDLLIKSVNKLNSKRVNFNLLIIGEGPQKKLLKKISKKGLEKGWIYFYGKTYNESELSKLIFSSDLMVSPGNTGLNAVHALSYGTPVGTHNNFNNQMPEAAIIEDKMTGFFFNENDSDDLSFKIELWFSKFNINLNRAERRRAIDEKYNSKYQIKEIQKALNKIY
jgi:glycosyltransferase involved in cell wall biosynthesis